MDEDGDARVRVISLCRSRNVAVERSAAGEVVDWVERKVESQDWEGGRWREEREERRLVEDWVVED